MQNIILYSFPLTLGWNLSSACSYPGQIHQVCSALKAESRANSVMATVAIKPLRFSFKAGNPVTELTNCQLSHCPPLPRGKKHPLFHLSNKPTPEDGVFSFTDTLYCNVTSIISELHKSVMHIDFRPGNINTLFAKYAQRVHGWDILYVLQS